ncbi:MAG: response regulator transcription factor [Aggregatilineales bacterium]
MNPKKIGIIVIDDHRRVHQALSEMFGFLDDMEILAHGSNGAEALTLCERYQPDLILMDVVMPVMDGVEATKRILAKYPTLKILALSSFTDPDTVREMLTNGAVGYLLKDASMEHLEHTIRTAIEGHSVLSPQMMQVLLNQPKTTENFHLSRREKEVLPLFANGMTNPEIATELTISESTVKFHITNILEKLNVKTRAEALVIAAKNNLV